MEKRERKQLIGCHSNRGQIPGLMEHQGITTAQIFLGSPRSWALPRDYQENSAPLPEIPIYAHANYLINPCSAREEVREKSTKSLQHHIDMAQHLGIKGIVVHGGQGGKGGSMEEAIKHWGECLEQLNITVPLLIENTAGGNTAPGRSLDSFSALWEVIEEYNVGYCIDTCHAWCGEMGLENLHERLVKALGRPTDLVHINGSNDTLGSGRDHHANLDLSQEQSQLSLEFARESGAPCILETPGGGGFNDITLLQEQLWG